MTKKVPDATQAVLEENVPRLTKLLVDSFRFILSTPEFENEAIEPNVIFSVLINFFVEMFAGTIISGDLELVATQHLEKILKLIHHESISRIIAYHTGKRPNEHH